MWKTPKNNFKKQQVKIRSRPAAFLCFFTCYQVYFFAPLAIVRQNTERMDSTPSMAFTGGDFSMREAIRPKAR